MSDESDRSIKYGDNRYGFHITIPEEKAGVSPEFAHDKVYFPVKSLGSKTDRALSLRPEDPDYRFAVELLNKCSLAIQNSLDNKIPQQPEIEDTESLGTSFSTRSF